MARKFKPDEIEQIKAIARQVIEEESGKAKKSESVKPKNEKTNFAE